MFATLLHHLAAHALAGFFVLHAPLHLLLAHAWARLSGGRLPYQAPDFG